VSKHEQIALIFDKFRLKEWKKLISKAFPRSKLVNGVSISHLNVTGNSKMIIEPGSFFSIQIKLIFEPSSTELHEIQSFDSISFFYVLRMNSKEDDSLAKQALRVQDGVLSVNVKQSF
jgi:hypothetical protein